MSTKLFPAGTNSLPSVAYEGDAGIDLRYSGVLPLSIVHKTVYKIHTGVYMEIPLGKCGIVFERSGLGAKHGITVHGRIIDSGYRGEIVVLMSRNCDGIYDSQTNEMLDVKPLVFNPGDKVAQLVIVDCHPLFEVVDSIEKLSKTQRGEKGLGSSGMKG